MSDNLNLTGEIFNFGKTRVFENYIIYQNEKIYLDEIWAINIDVKSRTSGFATINSAFCEILYSGEEKNSFPPSLLKGAIIGQINSTFLSNKETYKKTIQLIGIISRLTFNYRLNRYFSEIKKNGYFTTLDSVKIYNNGDLITRSGKTANICNAIKDGLLGFGEIGKGLRREEINPYPLIIYPNNGLKLNMFGIDLYSKIEIYGNINNDCLVEIVNILAKNGKILKL